VGAAGSAKEEGRKDKYEEDKREECKAGAWSYEEDTLLRSGVEKHGAENWMEIATCCLEEKRSVDQCASGGRFCSQSGGQRKGGGYGLSSGACKVASRSTLRAGLPGSVASDSPTNWTPTSTKTR
jgi:hypothetical protein